MLKRIGQNLFLILFICFTGCSQNVLMDEEQFKQRVYRLLKDQDSVDVRARELTDFDWEKLCFSREGKIRLRFYIDETKMKIVELDDDAFFIEENYVYASPTDRCVTQNELIIIEDKFIPRHSLIIFKIKKYYR